MDLTLMLDVNEIQEKSGAAEELLAQGYDNVADFVRDIVDFFTNADLSQKISVKAEKVVAADGTERFQYNGMVRARWFDKDGNVVLGIGNGDNVTVVVKNI